MLRHLWPVYALVSFLGLGGAGCAILPEKESKLADGAHCTEGTQCESGNCSRDELCSASSCDCPGDSCSADGEHSADCAPQSLCVVSTNLAEDIGQFFSDERDNDGYCQIPCSVGCPEHYSCSGQFCAPEPGWADPVPSATWSGAAKGSLSGKGAEMTVPLERGHAVTLTASASSPTDSKIASYAWNVVTEAGLETPVSGDSVEVTIEPGGSYSRAELTIQDAKMRGGVLYVIFEACSGAGEECGFQGSGCCNGCDDATNLCQ